MLLQDILDSKLAQVVKVHQDETVADTIRLLEDMNISGVFVVDDNDRLSGIFTEKDVVTCFATGVQAADTRVREVKRGGLITFEASTEVSEALAVASKKKMRHLPIVEGDEIKGMITYRDLVSHVLPEICFMAEAM